jgi:tetratricopeptide (TPR) repeat protein
MSDHGLAITLARQRARAAVARAAADRAEGRFAAARAGLTRALAECEGVLGSLHGDVALVLDQLAVVHRACGRLGDAERWWRRALHVIELGQGAPYLDHAQLRVHARLGALRRRRGRVAEAEVLLQRAVDLAELRLAADDAVPALAPVGVDAVAIRCALAEALAAQGRPAAASAELVIALADSDRAAALRRLGRQRLRDGQVAIAAGLYARAALIGLRALLRRT